MNERRYIEEKYSEFWEKQSYVYGIGNYENYILHEIETANPKNVFEVGIGNGYPFALSLKEKGIIVSGCDVAPRLVESTKSKLGGAYGDIKVGTINEISIEYTYDVVYCVRVSWYMKEKDFLRTLDKMIEITNNGGLIVFDVMKKWSPCFWNRIVTRLIFVYALQIVRWLVKGKFEIPPPNHMLNITKINRYLKSRGLNWHSIPERQITKEFHPFSQPKVLYVCKKIEGEYESKHGNKYKAVSHCAYI